ncbi:TOBE domain-containing protein [Faecalicatena contorta]|uniref:Molybdate transport system regulatory protein n=1 Tax=Faecalicatena contorta TaxID=39482 RepID=A0A315ZZA7_9FIRM|nr:TOBE domain-containing protein [Faecalicatena contorta]PWJ51001.1 molybdate transport system regulatory protein [Faecalicatena contorta]SUQ13569.1 molybdate transport system regulatory protein [Faecalicatena contorta]
MKLSARNQIAGKIVRVEEGAVNGIVALEFDGGTISGTISMVSIKELGLSPGKDAVAIIKATEVMIGLGNLILSARNKINGTISYIEEGAVNAIVTLDVPGNNHISATISMAAVKELELAVGKDAIAVIKASSVMFAAE